MTKTTMRISVFLFVFLLAAVLALVFSQSFSVAFAATSGTDQNSAETTESVAAGEKSSKAIAAAIVVGVVAAAGAISMGWAISKSNESTARQPEAGGQIRTGLMLGLVFIETAIIYALIVAILIIFVL